MLGIDGFYCGNDGLRRHDHARAAAEGIIVAFFVLIFGIVADIVHVDGQFLVALRTP